MSLGISSAQLTKMRSQVEELLPDTRVIQSSTHALDASGYPAETYAAVRGAQLPVGLTRSVIGRHNSNSMPSVKR